jgi:hypothetical protein
MTVQAQGGGDVYSIDFDSHLRVEISNLAIQTPEGELTYTVKWLFDGKVQSEEACKSL